MLDANYDVRLNICEAILLPLACRMIDEYHGISYPTPSLFHLEQVVTKVCFSLTLRVSNRPLLVRQGLPALCVKVLKARNTYPFHSGGRKWVTFSF